MTTDPKILSSHALYVKLTGFGDVDLDYGRERAWYEILKKFTDSDLRLVITYLQGEIRKQKRNPGCLRFSNLIGQPDLFQEELSMAKAAIRNARPAPDQRSQVLSAIGRTEPEQPVVVKTPETILKAGYENLMKEAGL